MNDDIINILNLNPLDVQSCISKKDNNSIVYHITLNRYLFICPDCSHKLVFKDYRSIVIHHNIIIGKNTKIILRRRRYFCSHCRTYHYDSNPFSSSRLSDISEIEIMNFLKEHSSTFSMTARVFRTSPTKVVDIFDRYGIMMALPLTEAICIDEIQWKHKGKNQYAAVIIDFRTGNIIDVIEGRTKEIWSSYLQIIPKEQKKRVKYISIDMFETYRIVKNIHFPDALLAVDSFHVVKNINKILNQLRINIMKQYDKESVEYYLLKKFYWLILMDSVNVKENKAKYNKKLKRYINYPQLLEMMLNINSSLKEGYDLKESYLLFNQRTKHEDARKDLAEMIALFAGSSIPSFQSFSSTLVSFFDEIVNSFIEVGGKRLSNGKIESVNSRISIILDNAWGYSNFSRLRNRIMFTLNKDSKITILENPPKIKREGKKRGKYKKKK